MADVGHAVHEAPAADGGGVVSVHLDVPARGGEVAMAGGVAGHEGGELHAVIARAGIGNEGEAQEGEESVYDLHPGSLGL